MKNRFATKLNKPSSIYAIFCFHRLPLLIRPIQGTLDKSAIFRAMPRKVGLSPHFGHKLFYPYTLSSAQTVTAQTLSETTYT